MRYGIGREGFIKGFLSILIVVALIFVGISFGKPYYRYNTLRSRTKDFLYTDPRQLETIKAHVLADAAELHIPLSADNVEVSLNDATKVKKVKATWSETVDFWGYYQKTLDFAMTVEY
jgi:hypothetical protein